MSSRFACSATVSLVKRRTSASLSSRRRPRGHYDRGTAIDIEIGADLGRAGSDNKSSEAEANETIRNKERSEDCNKQTTTIKRNWPSRAGRVASDSMATE
jgi:hypothetical protein